MFTFDSRRGSWPAPAKINLFLHVIGQRADGYHSLQTVFQFLDYSDELRFNVVDDGRIHRAYSVAGIPETSDLTLRAARLLQELSGATQGVRIALTKRIPSGSGLGGGSSDAATTLLALNKLWGINWPVSELAVLGLQLGADVPVFVRGHAAWAEGVGEVLTPIELNQQWFVVINPGVEVSTADVFSQLQLTHPHPAITIRDFLAGQETRNDLESLVCRSYPEVARALKWLRGYGTARMTGSGGCVFLEVPSVPEGRQILSKAPAPFTGFVARALNTHPLYS